MTEDFHKSGTPTSGAGAQPDITAEAQAAAQSGMPGSQAGASSAAPGGFGSKLKRLGSESLVYGLSSIVGRLLSYLLQPYYAHQFDPAQNGIQSVVYSYIPIISIALYLGMDVAYMRNAASVKQAPIAERQRAFSMSFGMVIAIGGVITGFAIGAASWLAPVAKLDVVAFRYMMAIVYTDALLAVPYAHLRMVNRSMRYAVLRLLFVAVSIGLNVVFIGHFHWGVDGIFMANLAANLTVLALFLAELAGLFRPGLLRHASWRALWIGDEAGIVSRLAGAPDRHAILPTRGVARAAHLDAGPPSGCGGLSRRRRPRRKIKRKGDPAPAAGHGDARPDSKRGATANCSRPSLVPAQVAAIRSVSRTCRPSLVECAPRHALLQEEWV